MENKEPLHIIKIGGNVIDDPLQLEEFIAAIAGVDDKFILVHGGGKLATQLSKQLGVETHMVDGRRITDAATLDIAIMTYAGLINKKIVANLNSKGKKAIGLSGADAQCLRATKRHAEPIDFGFVGDIDVQGVDAKLLSTIINLQMIPVIAPITCDDEGQLLNTNADTIASVLAKAMSSMYETKLWYCFEKSGVMENTDNETSLISELSHSQFVQLRNENKIHTGMIPKLTNAFGAFNEGVKEVYLIHSKVIHLLKSENYVGTKLVR